MSKQGKQKMDLCAAVLDQAEGDKTVQEMMQQHGPGYNMNKKKIDDAAKEIKQERMLEKQKAEMKDTKLK